MLSILLALALLALVLCQHDVARSRQHGNEAVSLSSMGVDLTFRDAAARSVLVGWARELDASAGDVTHAVAMERESTVVDRVNRGEWGSEAYHDYQRMAAGTGNVDSGNLLLEYGLKSSAMALVTSKDRTAIKALHKAVSQCLLEEVRELLRKGSLEEDAEEDERLSVESTLSDGSTPLLTATYHNCTPVVTYLIEEGADVGAVGAAGVTAVMIAAMRDLPEMIELLITHPSVSSNTINIGHKFAANTALHFAAELGSSRAVQTLCRLGADASLQSSVGATPLHVLAYSRKIDEASEGQVERIVAALTSAAECGAAVDGLMGGDTTALYLASQHNKEHVVRALLRAGADARLPMPVAAFKGKKHVATLGTTLAAEDHMLNSEAANGAEAIHAAVEEGHVGIVRILLEEGGSDINTVNMDTPPLVLAIMYGRKAVVQLLLEEGADVDARSLRDGGTPLYYATQARQQWTIRQLMARGADASLEQLSSGLTPLMLAAVTGHTDCLIAILDGVGAAGGDVVAAANLASFIKRGSTALHMAAAAGRSRAAMLLLRRGAGQSSDSRDAAGWLPLHHACKGGHVEVAAALLGEGSGASALANALGSVEGESPLALAIMAKSEELVRLLLARGADPNVELVLSFKGRRVRYTMLPLAVDMRSPAIIGLLLEAGVSPQSGGDLKSPLLHAVLKGCVECASALLRGGAACRIVVQGKRGSETLQGVARSRRDFDMLQLLAAHEECSEQM